MSDGRFHSGEVLATELGVSRTTIWKHIQGLEKLLGMKIHSVRGKGYRLSHAVELLDADSIFNCLQPENQNVQLDILHMVSSTNAYLLDRVRAGIRPWTICLAEGQTAGRGRRSRDWMSPFGTNLYMSLYVRIPLPPAELSGLSLAVGIAVTRSIRNLGIADIGLKWPNDIVSARGKVAGVLLEMIAEHQGPSDLVIGIGVNTKMPAYDTPTITQPWCDLDVLGGGEYVSRNRIASMIINELCAIVGDFQNNGFNVLRDEWLTYDRFYQQDVDIDSAGTSVSGRHVGISERGGLMLSTGGEVIELLGGEVSLRAANR